MPPPPPPLTRDTGRTLLPAPCKRPSLAAHATAAYMYGQAIPAAAAPSAPLDCRAATLWARQQAPSIGGRRAPSGGLALQAAGPEGMRAPHKRLTTTSGECERACVPAPTGGSSVCDWHTHIHTRRSVGPQANSLCATEALCVGGAQLCSLAAYTLGSNWLGLPCPSRQRQQLKRRRRWRRRQLQRRRRQQQHLRPQRFHRSLGRWPVSSAAPPPLASLASECSEAPAA